LGLGKCSYSLKSILLLTIEKLVYGGDGLAHLPADEGGRGKAAFIPFVLAAEKVEASIIEQKAGFARAQAEKVIEASPQRVVPPCPYFGTCCGCHYQHARYEHQLEIKGEILRETLRRTAKIELSSEIQVHASPPWNYRNRSRLQVQTTPFQAGYFKIRSHELLVVEECPISSPLINRAIKALWESGRAGSVPAGIREIEFFANADDSQLMVELSCSLEARRAPVRAWAEEFQGSMPEICGLVAFRDSKGREAPERLLSVGSNHLTYETKNAAYRVSAGSFFQVNRHMTDELVQIVTGGQSGELALDLYAGVGLFSTTLAGDFHHIFSVESSQTSSADLAYNLPENGKSVQASTEQYLARLEESRRVGKGGFLPQSTHTPDLAVIDPPRSGLGERVARKLANLGAPRVVYVSCDPATLARDLVVFLAAGYRMEQVHLVDLFPQTYHLETVVHLVR
jgi:23S rRNA (uracil1939-C5)-methyltransferase